MANKIQPLIKSTYLLLSFLTILGFSPSLQASNQSETCEILKSRSSEFIETLNKEFNNNVDLEWRTTTNSWAPEMTRKARLSDARMGDNGKTIWFADLCGLDTTPSWETIALILAHEFAHFIFDRDFASFVKCDDEIYPPRQNPYKHRLGYKLRPAHTHLWHTNVDLFGLKILNHFNIDENKAIDGITKLIDQEISPGIEWIGWRGRMTLLRSKIPTNFQNSDDMYQVGRFDGIAKTSFFLSKHYPDSTFLHPFQTKTKVRNSCRYFPTRGKDLHNEPLLSPLSFYKIDEEDKESVTPEEILSRIREK